MMQTAAGAEVRRHQLALMGGHCLALRLEAAEGLALPWLQRLLMMIKMLVQVQVVAER